MPTIETNFAHYQSNSWGPVIHRQFALWSPAGSIFHFTTIESFQRIPISQFQQQNKVVLPGAFVHLALLMIQNWISTSGMQQPPPMLQKKAAARSQGFPLQRHLDAPLWGQGMHHPVPPRSPSLGRGLQAVTQEKDTFIKFLEATITEFGCYKGGLHNDLPQKNYLILTNICSVQH